MLIEDPADNAALVLKGFWQHKKLIMYEAIFEVICTFCRPEKN